MTTTEQEFMDSTLIDCEKKDYVREYIEENINLEGNKRATYQLMKLILESHSEGDCIKGALCKEDDSYHFIILLMYSILFDRNSINKDYSRVLNDCNELIDEQFKLEKEIYSLKKTLETLSKKIDEMSLLCRSV